MSEEWYFTIGGRQTGPVSTAQLKQLASSGQLSRTDMVWKYGMLDWLPAGNLTGLFVAPNPYPPPPVSGTPPPVSGASKLDNGVTYAGFWKRFVANFIDAIIVAVPMCCMCYAPLGMYFEALKTPDDDPGFQLTTLLAQLLVSILCWIYYAAMESSDTQGTLGKMAVGIKVTDLYGNKITFIRATGRYFGKIPSGMTLCIGFLMVAFTERKQGLHDIMAECLVINK